MASKSEPFVGIDFGTSYCAASWYDEKTGKAEAFFNSGGEVKMPTVAYYGPKETSIGQAALFSFEDDILHGDITATQRIVASIKRNLLSPPVIALPESRTIRPVEVVSAVIKKLKTEIEEGRFYQKVGKAVVTVPAAFSAEERAVIEAGARMAGFEDVQLLDEPVAAAMAYAAEGQKVGDNILVYDLGGGTFDLAVLTRHGKDGFELALPPAGLPRCGGDDFDVALYRHVVNELTKQNVTLGRNGGVDLLALAECRRAKEKLSDAPRANIQLLLDGHGYVVRVTREQYEGLIRERVLQTMRQTRQLLSQASANGCKIDTVVMVGGSSRSPLVIAELQKTLREAGLGCEPLRYDHQDIAVTLGASYSRNATGCAGPGPTKHITATVSGEINYDASYPDFRSNIEHCASLCDRAAESYARGNPIESTRSLLGQAISLCGERKEIIKYFLKALSGKLLFTNMHPVFYTNDTVSVKCKSRLLNKLNGFIENKEVYVYHSTAKLLEGAKGFIIYEDGICWKNATDECYCITFDHPGLKDIKYKYSFFTTTNYFLWIGTQLRIGMEYSPGTGSILVGVLQLIYFISHS